MFLAQASELESFLICLKMILVLAGDNEVIANQGVEEAYKAVDAAIDEAFK